MLYGAKFKKLKDTHFKYNIMAKLRTGYTTGTCAAAGAKAALMLMGGTKTSTVEVLLPRGDYIKIPVQSCGLTSNGAACVIIKDGGDDPDVTHGAQIVTEVSAGDTGGIITILGGNGVGTVTKPGLGLDIGGPAINPVPRRMIQENLMEVDTDIIETSGLNVVISVPAGRELAPKTDNPRLGIVGGISILGTSGIVIPFSTASFAASIRQNLDVAIAMKSDTVALTTGGRSEQYIRKLVKLPDHCYVQMGDFSGYAMQQCGKKGLKKAYVVGFVGKLAKMAAGVSQTHVKGSKVDMKLLSEIARDCGASDSVIYDILRANTARHVMELVQKSNVPNFFDKVCHLVHTHMKSRAGDTNVDVIMFDFEGSVIGQAS